MKKIFSSLFLSAILFSFGNLLFAQANNVKQIKLTKFNLQSSAVIKDDGQTISASDYQSKNYWFPVTVPCTVLSGLVQNKVYADPYIGMNNMLIPDASDSFNHQYNLAQYSFLPNEPNPWKKPYWYRTSFNVPATDKGKYFQLIFKGINYRADVWLNGKQIADSSQMVGMFAEYSLNASDAIKPGDENILAVKIYPLDYPGLPSHPQLDALGDFYANGGPTGDIGKNVTMLSSVGWDWIPAVRDRNMGIWLPVYLRTTGNVVISQPFIKTEFPSLPDTSVAKLSLQLSLINHGDQHQNGALKISIIPENFSGSSISFTKAISINANENKSIQFTSDDVKELLIKNPHLWWPNNYGDANLYRLHIQYTNNNQISDDTSFSFGIRTVSSNAVDVNGWTRRDFYVNGKRVHLNGGAWVPDMMLNRDSLRYDEELHLCRNANVNLVRIWGGGLGETDEFYEAADCYGMLVWQDFWVTGDTQGEFKGSPDWPLQGNVFIRNIISTIYRIRNHASLLVWTGGNEGHARKELYDAMRDNVSTLDVTRPFIPSSSGFAKQAAGWKGSWPDDKPAGVYSGGPYSWQEDAQYYKLVDGGKDWVFKDETGIPSQPPYNTLKKIIPDLVPDSSLPYPLNNTWGYHDACAGNGHYETYYNAMKKYYGEPTSIKDFSNKMQLINANGYRSIFEAAGHKLNETGGVMLWKLNAAFPSVIWQIYDWYLEPNAGYYFMKRAVEPLHIQFNLDDSAVAVINRTYHAQSSLNYVAEVFNINGKCLYKKDGTINADATSENEILQLADVLKNINGVSFISLQLKDKNKKPVSENFYWMSPNHDFTSLKQMQPAILNVKIIQPQIIKNQYQLTLELSNPSKQIAFFINPQLMNGDEEVLPSFWSDNYFSINAGKNKTITVSCATDKINQTITKLKVEGWNLKEQTISLPSNINSAK
ncbi:MAG: beta galactosidase jelly roll domain-containing protein [Parafilimonas sp.]